MPENFMTAEHILSEFGLTTEGLPVAGVRMIDHQPVYLYRETDVIKPEKDFDNE